MEAPYLTMSQILALNRAARDRFLLFLYVPSGHQSPEDGSELPPRLEDLVSMAETDPDMFGERGLSPVSTPRPRAATW